MGYSIATRICNRFTDWVLIWVSNNLTKIFDMETKIKMIICLFAVLVTGCTIDDKLQENPPHIITADKLYTNYTGFEMGVNAAYSEIRYEIKDDNMPF